MGKPIKQRVARTALQVLQAMYWIIDNIGWIQSNFTKKNEKGEPIAFCLLGARNNVVTDTTDPNLRYLVVEKMNAFLTEHYQWHGGIAGWNDVPQRTKPQVLAMLKALIKQEQKKTKKK